MTHAAPPRSTATVWLVGMMGAGKSAVGPGLAQRLARRFVDADQEIARRAGARVDEIFAREGEAGFRARERAELEAWAGQRAVVALGGGAIAQPGARELLTRSGLVAWLRARPETLLRRVGATDERPLLAGLDPAARLERLRALSSEREPCYASAHVVVDTDEAGVEEVVESLAKQLVEAGA